MMSRRSLFRSAAAAGGLSLWGGSALGAQSAASAGFWYPEETDPHERTFMQWPVNRKVHDDPDFLADLQGTIADIANYTYVAHAPEGNVSLQPYPNVRAWLERIEALPGFVPMQRTAAGLQSN